MAVVTRLIIKYNIYYGDKPSASPRHTPHHPIVQADFFPSPNNDDNKCRTLAFSLLYTDTRSFPTNPITHQLTDPFHRS